MNPEGKHLKCSGNMAAMKKADILKKREIHRGDPQDHVLRFTLNYSAQARLMHSFLPPTKGKEDVLQAAVLQIYVVVRKEIIHAQYFVALG